MAKAKNLFVCSDCGFQCPKWLGQCPECHAWGTLEETLVEKKLQSSVLKPVEVNRFADIGLDSTTRIHCGNTEMDRVLGGGFVPGTVLLFGGEPGVGKSTLLLQLFANLADAYSVLYISGEESVGQIKLRGMRLGLSADGILVAHETRLEPLVELLEQLKPKFVVVDSIQTLQSVQLGSPSGTVSQVRHCAQCLIDWTKGAAATLVLVGHITKEGVIAGPKTLEHMVDGVFLFEGERDGELRLIRAQKNRFGPISELGIFRMTEKGLEVVPNPSALLIRQRPQNAPGSVIVPCVEGSRVFLVELQVLVTSTQFPSPRRLTNGVDPNRLAMVLAVLEKKAGLQIQGYDVFVNVAGGLQVREPAMDLAIAVGVYSAFRNLPVAEELAVFGELGLAGEVRPVSKSDLRIQECRHFGFKKVLRPPAEGDEALGQFTNSLMAALERAF
ncbi:MAG: DNA repair protein RadA [Acidobacteria bacterium]|nr:DNA repair protein RadA [Acidobacteriota bacterium]